MNTLTRTLSLALAILAFQSPVFAQNQSGETDWNAVLQEARQRADANATQGDKAESDDGGTEQSSEALSQQRTDDAQSRADERGDKPLSGETQAIMDEARARAETNKANEGVAPEPTDDEKFCAAVLCLSKDSPLPSECKGPVKDYFDVRVYKKGTFKTKYNPPATAIKRDYKVKTECKWTPAKDRAKIAAKYGLLERSPFVFN